MTEERLYDPEGEHAAAYEKALSSLLSQSGLQTLFTHEFKHEESALLHLGANAVRAVKKEEEADPRASSSTLALMLAGSNASQISGGASGL